MNMLKNLKIKSKLRIPIILLLILLLISGYLYYYTHSVIRSQLQEKTAFSAVSDKISTLYCTFTDYLHKKKSYDQLTAAYRPLLQLKENEDFFAPEEQTQLTALEKEFNKIETLFQENLQVEKEASELAGAFLKQSDDVLKGNVRLFQQNPTLVGKIYTLAQRVLDSRVVFFQLIRQDEKEAELTERLNQAVTDSETAEQRLGNTLPGQLPQKAKESILKTREAASKIIENSKTASSQAQDKIAPIFDALSASLRQKESGPLGTIVKTVKDTFLKLLITALVILFLVLVVLLAAGRLLTRPLRAMIERAYDLAVENVDMTKRLPVDSRDETGELSGWFNKFLERLHQLIIRVRNSSDEVLNATKEITAGSDDLAARTSELAASITETSATLEKFTETIRQNTENSAEADMMLVEFNQEIQEKSSLIDNVTNTMTEIYESSKQIDNIIKVINDISFQTNLLALNAAVEAARAGEAGRGFAVVASEVRNLAQKTAESSKTIQDIVLRNVESTQKGMKLVKDTSEFFGQIVGVMGEIVEKVSNITEISRQQSDNIEQITVTIGQMDQVAIHNAQLVQELSETGKKVKSNAVELQDLVIQFNVDETSAPTSTGKNGKDRDRKDKKAKPTSPTPHPSPSSPSAKKEKPAAQAKKTAERPQPPKKEKGKEKNKEKIKEKPAEPADTTSTTEDDFFGGTDEDGFVEF